MWTAWRGQRARWFLVPLRVIVGFGFVAHGYAKLERGPDHFADVIAAIGLPMPELTAWVTTFVEVACGGALMFGLAVTVACAVSSVVMLTALFTVHLRYGFSSVRLVELSHAGARFGPVGYEINLLYLGALVALAGAGPTPWSIDGWRRARLSRRQPAGEVD